MPSDGGRFLKPNRGLNYQSWTAVYSLANRYKKDVSNDGRHKRETRAEEKGIVNQLTLKSRRPRSLIRRPEDSSRGVAEVGFQKKISTH